MMVPQTSSAMLDNVEQPHYRWQWQCELAFLGLVIAEKAAITWHVLVNDWMTTHRRLHWLGDIDGFYED